MNRIVVWTIAGVLVAGTAAAIAVNAEHRGGAVLIPGNNPVTEDQVRTQLQADGWSDMRIRRDGRLFDVIAVKGNQPRTMTVDSQTGRLASDDNDDD